MTTAVQDATTRYHRGADFLVCSAMRLQGERRLTDRRGGEKTARQ